MIRKEADVPQFEVLSRVWKRTIAIELYFHAPALNTHLHRVAIRQYHPQVHRASQHVRRGVLSHGKWWCWCHGVTSSAMTVQ